METDLEPLKKKAEYLRSIGQSAIADDYLFMIKKIQQLEKIYKNTGC